MCDSPGHASHARHGKPCGALVSGVAHPGRLHRSGTTVSTCSPSQTLPVPPCSRRRREPVALAILGQRAVQCSARIPCRIPIKGDH